MPLSSNTTIASGLTAVVNLTFGYLAKDHVHVKVDGAQTPDAELSWNSSSQIQLTVTPIAGATVTVYRTTPMDGLLNAFTNPAAFAGPDLTNSFLQMLYIVQESTDASEHATEVVDDIIDTALQLQAIALQVQEDRSVVEAGLLAVSTLYATQALAQAAFIPNIVKSLRLTGYTVAGDSPSADYIRVATQPSHTGKLRSTDRFLPNGGTDNTNGGWWELKVTVLDSRMLGVPASAANCAVAFQAFIDCAWTLGVPARVHQGAVYDFPSGSISLPAGLDLDLSGVTLRRTVDLTIPLLQAIGTNGSPLYGGRIRGGLLKYTAGSTTTSGTNSTALWLNFCRSWRVTDIKVEGPFYIGIRYDDCRDSTLDKFEVWGAYNRAVYVAATVYTEDVHVSNGLCDGYALGTGTQLTDHIVNTNGYGTGTGKNITFTNIIARGATSSPTGEAFAFTDRITRQKAVNCRAYDCPTGFLIVKANTFAAQNVQLVNCEAEGCDRSVYGIDSIGIQVVGFLSTGHKVSGIEMNNCVKVKIVGSTFDGAGVGSCDGVLLNGTTSGVLIAVVDATNNTGTGFKSTSGTSSIVGRACHSVLNGTGANMLGASGIDFPTSAASGNLIL